MTEGNWCRTWAYLEVRLGLEAVKEVFAHDVGPLEQDFNLLARVARQALRVPKKHRKKSFAHDSTLFVIFEGFQYSRL